MRLRQILTNLASNALKFTSDGEVSLRVSLLRNDLGQSFLNFEVADTGIGISKEQQQRIFSAFAQADMSTTRRFGGTGLGLSISERLVRLMGGTIQVDSIPNHGSRFSFSLPLQPVSADVLSEAEAAAHAEEPFLKGSRILVSAAKQMDRNQLRTLLERRGAEVITVADCGSAASRINGDPLLPVHFVICAYPKECLHSFRVASSICAMVCPP